MSMGVSGGRETIKKIFVHILNKFNDVLDDTHLVDNLHVY
jgi:hypothetical protein